MVHFRFVLKHGLKESIACVSCDLLSDTVFVTRPSYVYVKSFSIHVIVLTSEYFPRSAESHMRAEIMSRDEACSLEACQIR